MENIKNNVEKSFFIHYSYIYRFRNVETVAVMLYQQTEQFGSPWISKNLKKLGNGREKKEERLALGNIRQPDVVVVSMLNFRYEDRLFEAQSLPSCCFLSRQETLLTLPLSTQVYKMGTGDILLR